MHQLQSEKLNAQLDDEINFIENNYKIKLNAADYSVHTSLNYQHSHL